ncbi:MAG TPA: SDR family NAD(P)-dependent oxidoreductase, partial [Blastocatellia bacterium]|nr:SDR family NAD(P)-dependent oxidoreductase [Blastocatellia bacterium]
RAIDRLRISHDVRMLVASNRLFDVSGAEKTSPEKATLLGPCKVMPQEFLNVSCRLVDLVVPETETERERLVEQLPREALGAGGDRIIAYRGVRRLVESYEPVRLEGARTPFEALREGGVYLLTGGLGSVGLLLAEYLARTVKARLVLISRSPFPDRTEWDGWLNQHSPSDSSSRKILKLRQIHDLAADVFITRADASDYEQMARVFDLIDRRYGQLNGVIHLAGVTSGPSVLRPVSELGTEESDMQFRSKASALYVLERLLVGRTPDFCILFSSNAAVLGGLGMAAYAAANAFMDAFAAARQTGATVRWISANWDAWPYEPEPDHALRHRSIDDYAMTAAEAAETFNLIVSNRASGHLVVSTGNLNERLRLWVRRDRMSEQEPDAGRDSPGSAQSSRGEYVGPQNDLQRLIAETWQALLGIESIGISQNFFDLGGHSLLATRVVSRLREALNLPLALRAIFEHPTIAGLATVISELQTGAAEGTGPSDTAAPAEPADQLAAGIDSLSDDQVSSLLGQLFQNEGAD